MIEIVKTINGVKKLVPLTTDSGQGLPLGAWTSFEDDKPRNGYLKAGTTFNQSDYPALYNMLGTNVVPDKGYGLDWDNAEAITLSTTDYVVQKNGWIVGTFITSPTGNALLNGTVIAKATNEPTFNYSGQIQVEVKAGDILKTTTTVIEQFMSFVPYLHPMFIKAVIGPIEDNAADQVVQTVTDNIEEVVSYYGEQWSGNQQSYTTTFNETPKKGKYQVSIVVKSGSASPSCGGYILSASASALSDDNMPNLCGECQASALNILSAQFSQLVYFDGNTNTLTFNYLFASNNARIQITKVS